MYLRCGKVVWVKSGKSLPHVHLEMRFVFVCKIKGRKKRKERKVKALSLCDKNCNSILL